jgi:hypothetical protein
MSEFWKHYEAAKPHIAAGVDDIRHKLIEEGWFQKTEGRQVTGNIAPSAGGETTNIDNSTNILDQSTTTHHHQHHDLYESVWGAEPAPGDLYGNGPAPGTDIKPPSPAAAPQQDDGLAPGY